MTRLWALLPLISLLVTTNAWAEEAAAEAATPKFNALDTLWVLVAAVLVFFMQAGFGMVEAGLVRAKNTANVLMKNVLDFCFAALGYFIFGYAIMYGGSGPLVGTSGWFMAGATSPVDALPVEAFWLFQAVFAGAAATIVAGAVAERMRFLAYLAYSFIISAFVYPVGGHWVWGGGWLSELGFHDFAGSTVVHAVGGVSALIGAWLVGPRVGRFNKDGSPNSIGGHSLPLATLGMLILWFGWYGFNAGSTLGMGDPVLVVFGVEWLNKLRIDDPVGAIPVHFLCGIWGTVAVGLFGQQALGATSDGLFYGGGFGALGTQCLGIVSVLGFTAVVMFIVFKAIDATIGLRVPLETELRGLDHDEHGMESYGGFQIFVAE
jgi:Amt family ammonium transporter